MSEAAAVVLHCTSCDAPIPLGDGDVATCPFCKAAVAIPAEQRAVRDATRADAAARVRAEALYREVGRPPSLVFRVFARVSPIFLLFGGCVLVLLGSYGAFFTGGLWIGRRLFHAVLLDTLSESALTLVPTALAFVLGLAFAVLGAYARRRAVSLRAVQSGLAARLPKREGGPITCRQCGAPLTVPAGADGVICDYCRADNLVRVPAAWLKGIAKGTAKLAHATDKAVAAHRAELSALRSRLRFRLILWTIITTVIGGSLAAAVIHTDPSSARLEDWPPSWKRDVHGARTLHAHRAAANGLEEPIHPDHAIAPSCKALWLEPSLGAVSSEGACDSERCRFRWIVALRHGEHLVAHTNELAGVAIQFYDHDPGAAFDDDDFSLDRSATLDPAKPATFIAPLSAWYEVGMSIADMGPRHGRSLCFEVVR